MIKSGNVTVMVADMDEAVRFYTEVLGLSLRFRVRDEWAEVSAPGLTIGLHPPGEGTSPPGTRGSLSVGLQVDSLEETMEALKAKGVAFREGITEDSAVRLAFFPDPDGNPLYLCEQKHW